MKFVEKIKTMKEERKWSVYKLALVSDISDSTVRNIFKRGTDPSLSTLECLCKGFGITMSQFFAEEGESVQLTDEQRDIINLWGSLPQKERESLKIIIKSIVEKKP